jgi:hypothetical protein
MKQVCHKTHKEKNGEGEEMRGHLQGRGKKLKNVLDVWGGHRIA